MLSRSFRVFVNRFSGAPLRGLFSVFGFGERFQIAEIHLPEAAVLIEPEIESTQGFGIEAVNAMAAFAPLAHEMGAAEQSQVPGNGWTGNRKSLRDGAGRLAASA
jgi:hypothetical protein